MDKIGPGFTKTEETLLRQARELQTELARLKARVAENVKCNYGTGKQDMTTCPMIYIHWPGYYPTEESYQEAMRLLCPNTPTAKESE